MEIYLYTSRRDDLYDTPYQEYRWYQILEDNELVENSVPDIFPVYHNLLDPIAFSFLLRQSHEACWMAVMNLAASQRNSQGKKVRHSFIFKAAPIEAKLLQRLAARLLADPEGTAKVLNTFVKEQKEWPGFIVTYGAMIEWLWRLQEQTTPVQHTNPRLLEKRLARHTPARRLDLAKWLMNHALPEGEGVIIATGFVSPEKLESLPELWWGLSELEESEEWRARRQAVHSTNDIHMIHHQPVVSEIPELPQSPAPLTGGIAYLAIGAMVWGVFQLAAPHCPHGVDCVSTQKDVEVHTNKKNHAPDIQPMGTIVHQSSQAFSPSPQSSMEAPASMSGRSLDHIQPVGTLVAPKESTATMTSAPVSTTATSPGEKVVAPVAPPSETVSPQPSPPDAMPQEKSAPASQAPVPQESMASPPIIVAPAIQLAPAAPGTDSSMAPPAPAVMPPPSQVPSAVMGYPATVPPAEYGQPPALYPAQPAMEPPSMMLPMATPPEVHSYVPPSS